MNYNKKFIAGFITFSLLIVVSVLSAQTTFQMGDSQKFVVKGTSTIHDWDMESEGARGQAQIVIEDGELKDIESLSVQVPVKSMKSGSNRMDRTAYSAIEADDHQYIQFDLTRVRNITSEHVLATGTLTIAGNTRTVSVRTNYQVNGNSVQFYGDQDISFSQFDLDPPTAMLGSIRTGDNLEVSFDVNFDSSSRAK